jgi:hypothetical protein
MNKSCRLQCFASFLCFNNKHLFSLVLSSFLFKLMHSVTSLKVFCMLSIYIYICMLVGAQYAFYDCDWFEWVGHSQFKFHEVSNGMKLVLHGDEPSPNLHAVEWWLDLPRETCTITNDNGGMIFNDEVQPKPTSSWHDYRRALLPNTATPTDLESWHYATFPVSLLLCHHGYNCSPLSYLRGGSGCSVWHRLYPILLHTTQFPS